MAKIVLNVQSDTKQAIKSIGELSAKIEEVASAYSKMSAKAQNAQIREEKLATQRAKTASIQAQSEAKLATQKAKTAVETAKEQVQLAKLEKVQRTTVSTVERLQKKYADLLNTIKSIENRYPAGTFDALKNSVNQNLQATKNLTEGSEELEKEYVKLAAQVSTVRAETEKNTTAVVQNGDSIASLAKKFVLWQFAATAVMKPIQLLRSAIASINTTLVETENRVVELQRVAGQAANASELYKLAQQYGQTFENVSEAALNFARRGMSWNESLRATEAALLAINVAELDVGQATDGLGSIMAQFGKDASELTNVVDMLNKTADNFPVTTEKILAALQRVGSTATTANLSLEETVGLITTLSKATNRSGQNIGTALNSIINISQKSSTLDTFASVSKETRAIVEQYRAGATSILEVLKVVASETQKLGTSTVLDSADFAALNEELKEAMGEDFEILSEIYGTAGTYRRNYFVALLNDLDTVKEVQEEIRTANGYSAKENEQYLNTYAAKSNALKAQWQEYANDEQGLLKVKKELVEMGSVLLTITKYTGGIEGIVVAIGAVLAEIYAKQLTIGLMKLGDAFAKLGASIKGLFTSKIGAKDFFSAPIKSIKELRKATDEYRKAQKLSTAATKEQQAATELHVQAQEAQATAEELSAVAAQKKAYAEELAASGTATATAMAEANEAATNAQTIADEAQTAATQLQTKAQEAQTVATQKGIVASKAMEGASKSLGAAASSAAGIWGIIAFAIYELVNAIGQAVQASKKAAEEAQRQAKERISAARSEISAHKETAQSIADYITTLEELAERTDDVEERTNGLVSIQKLMKQANLDVADSIDTVNNSLEKNIELIKEKSVEQLKAWQRENQQAIQDAKKLVEGSNTSTLQTLSQSESSKLLGIAQAAGLNFKDAGSDYNYWKDQNWYQYLYGKGEIKDIWDVITGEQDLMGGAFNWVNSFKMPDPKYGLSILGSPEEKIKQLNDLYTAVEQNATLSKEEKDTYLAYLSNYINTINSDDFKDALAIYKYNQEVDKLIKEGTSGNSIFGKQIEKLEDIERGWDKIVERLKEYRDLNKEALTLQEKQLAVAEAQKALDEAKSSRKIYRYSETNGWEWVQDEKEIASAEDNLQKAVDALNQYVEEQAWNEVTDKLATGNATNALILEILEKWAEEGYGDDPEWLANIKAGIKEVTGVDLDKTYDNGGIAYGLGSMVKATSRPEAVLNPDLTAKILSPTSNAEFERALANIGAMYETGQHIARQPQMISSATTTNTTNTDNSVTINGMRLTAEQSNQLLAVLDMIGLVQK